MAAGRVQEHRELVSAYSSGKLHPQGSQKGRRIRSPSSCPKKSEDGIFGSTLKTLRSQELSSRDEPSSSETSSRSRHRMFRIASTSPTPVIPGGTGCPPPPFVVSEPRFRGVPEMKSFLTSKSCPRADPEPVPALRTDDTTSLKRDKSLHTDARTRFPGTRRLCIPRSPVLQPLSTLELRYPLEMSMSTAHKVPWPRPCGYLCSFISSENATRAPVWRTEVSPVREQSIHQAQAYLT